MLPPATAFFHCNKKEKNASNQRVFMIILPTEKTNNNNCNNQLELLW